VLDAEHNGLPQAYASGACSVLRFSGGCSRSSQYPPATAGGFTTRARETHLCPAILNCIQQAAVRASADRQEHDTEQRHHL
jgi:hypothetical protein